MTGPTGGVLAAFGRRNFSVYFAGQVITNTGSWFQNLALSLVILDVTGSAQALSGVTVAQFSPILLLSVAAGRLADRIAPRTILMVGALASAAIVGGLALVVAGEAPPVWLLYVFVAALGAVHAFERVAAQAIIVELSGRALLARAVSISTVSQAAARSIGPGLAGLAFEGFGPATCMALNAASFILVLVSLLAIRPADLYSRPAERDDVPVRFGDLIRDRRIATLLVINVVIALLATNLMLVLTSTVTLTFAGSASAVGTVHALNAVGGVAGGLLAAARAVVSVRTLTGGAALYGVGLLLSAAAPTLTVLLWVAPVLGLGFGYYLGVLYAAAQVSAPPRALGRVMSLVTLGNYGMVPFGALIMGAVIDATSGRVALAVGCAASVTAAILAAVRHRG